MRVWRIGCLFASLMLVVAVSASTPGRADVALRSGDTVVYGRADAGALVAGTDNPIIRFSEFEGESVVARVTPIDRDGRANGAGRVVVVLAHEQREFRLRDEFAAEALDNVRFASRSSRVADV